MQNVVNIHEAKTHLSRIVEQAVSGHTTIIAKAGRQVAKIVPLEPAIRVKRLGGLQGRFEVPDDFNAPLDHDILDAFEDRQ
jgi:prevent-host-death family protein